MHTAYLGMEENSSPDTRSRAKNLAKDVSLYIFPHSEYNYVGMTEFLAFFGLVQILETWEWEFRGKG